MDESLKDADASFIGEDADDYSGRTVAGAGDVNGDGYDDILIGAYYDEDGGYRAGQTYLILGSSSGLSMDTSLSNADASFIGEEPYDRAGYSIAGAGDVNDDGFDDFLIGSQYNDEGGKEAGQAYLILGRASGWTMDTDLSQADASFIGEEIGDWAGVSVGGAGDVNGDGIDDFLIGAYHNDEGGEWAGQTYLFFGNRSGWSMDTDLADANASLIGPFPGAASGFAVAGAGDVNGDGYDDILVGGYGGRDVQEISMGYTFIVFGRSSGWSMDFNMTNANASYRGQRGMDFSGWSVSSAGDVNDDGYDDVLIGAKNSWSVADDAGEAYLILGKASGWKQDVRLSDVDASFWGESGDELAGYSVSGAGDVNRDGYDDFIIGAPSNSEGGTASGQSYLVLGRSYGWEMNTSLADVDVSFWGEVNNDRSGWSVAGAGDVNDDGYDDILIGAFANDEGGDYAGQSYLVYGMATPPRIQKDSTLGVATTGDTFTFNVTVSSSYAVSTVSVEYWYGDAGPRINGTASLEIGNLTRGTWHLDITIIYDSNESLHYVVHVADGTFTTRSGMLNVSVLDNDPPLLSDDTTPSSATTGDELEFAVNVTDNIELAEVRVEYWSGESSTGMNDSMTRAQGDIWNLTIRMPVDTLETLHYRFYAMDAAHINATTGVRNITLVDDDPPVLEEDLTPKNATTGDPFTFSVIISDNIRMGVVNVSYWFEDTGLSTSVKMLEGSEGTWTLTITVPSDSLEPIHYVFTAIDNATNTHVSIPRMVEVMDDDPPVFGDDLTPNNGTTGDAFTFIVHVLDNIGIEEVYVTYRYGDGEPGDVTLNESEPGRWQAIIDIEDTLDALVYEFVAVDTAGNENILSGAHVEIIDNDLPEVVEDDTPVTAYTGDPLMFRIVARDNVGIDEVRVTFAFVNSTPVTAAMEPRGGGGVFTFTIDVPIDCAGSLIYSLSVVDLSGNRLVQSDREVSIKDDDAPEIMYADTITDAIKGLPLSLSVKASDNMGITSVHAIVRYGNGAKQNLTMILVDDYSVEVIVPREPGGDLFVHFSARDGASNWYSTEVYTIELVNVPPEVAEMPRWSVTEEEEAILDLETYLTDENDDVSNLTLECNDKTITVDGLVLKTIYHEAVPDWSILLTVSDGEDEVEVDVTVHVVNVNDAPEIISVQPINGTEFPQGETITFTVVASDEDHDELSFLWYRGERELGSGPEIRSSSLPAGRHIIRLEVSDGITTSEMEIEITVLADSKDYNIMIIVVTIIILMAIIAMILLYKRNKP